nr:MAG TPA: hypothetical protein [Caudoviricetes sp.]
MVKRYGGFILLCNKKNITTRLKIMRKSSGNSNKSSTFALC